MQTQSSNRGQAKMDKSVAAALIATVLSSSVVVAECATPVQQYCVNVRTHGAQRPPKTYHQAQMTHTIRAIANYCRRPLVLRVLVLSNSKRSRMLPRWSASGSKPTFIVDCGSAPAPSRDDFHEDLTRIDLQDINDPQQFQHVNPPLASPIVRHEGLIRSSQRSEVIHLM